MKLCIIDDEPWALRDIMTIVNWASYGFSDIQGFENAVSALNYIRTNNPEVVITDVRMPGMTGLELINICHKEGLEPVFAVISAYAEFEYARQAVECGATSYILKPIKPQTVKELAVKLVSEAEKKKKQKDVTSNVLQDHTPIGQIIEYVDHHYTDQLTLEGLADTYGFSLSHLSRTFKKKAGVSFVEYVTKLRIDYASTLLRETEMSMMQISQACGFQDYFHFSKVFRRKTSLSPSEFRKGIKNEK